MYVVLGRYLLVPSLQGGGTKGFSLEKGGKVPSCAPVLALPLVVEWSASPSLFRPTRAQTERETCRYLHAYLPGNDDQGICSTRSMLVHDRGRVGCAGTADHRGS